MALDKFVRTVRLIHNNPNSPSILRAYIQGPSTRSRRTPVPTADKWRRPFIVPGSPRTSSSLTHLELGPCVVGRLLKNHSNSTKNPFFRNNSNQNHKSVLKAYNSQHLKQEHPPVDFSFYPGAKHSSGVYGRPEADVHATLNHWLQSHGHPARKGVS